MRYLLDTHILLWALSNDYQLPPKARMIIEDDDNNIYYSVISIWEVALKHTAHPAQLTLTAREASGYCQMAGFKRLLLEDKHIFYVDSLYRPDDAPAHKDPFDRILISQAKAEGFLFLTHDQLLLDYGEPCLIYV